MRHCRPAVPFALVLLAIALTVPLRVDAQSPAEPPLRSTDLPLERPAAATGASLAERMGNLIVSWSGGTIGTDHDFEYISDLGLRAAETNAFWGPPSPHGIEKARGQYDFSSLDRLTARLGNAGVSEISLAVFPENALYGVRGSRFTSEEQWLAFGKFLEALVAHFPEVGCYQIARELNRERLVTSAREYARLVEFSSRIVKRGNPRAAVAFCGLPYDLRGKDGRESFLADVIAELPADERHFDAIDIHVHQGLTREDGTAGVESAFRFYVGQLSGIYTDSRVLFETSVYTGTPRGSTRQSEQDQAGDLVGRLDRLRELGVHRASLEGGIYQRPFLLFVGGRPSGHLDYFEHTGLVWNCEVDRDADTPSCSSGRPKKAYQALKEWLRANR
jgi:hypothetical protein